MATKLYMHPVSTTSRPVLLFVAESGANVELVTIDLFTGEHMKEPFTKLNPNKQVPVLVEDDFVLTESSAILKYLADKINSPAYPKDLRRRAHVNELMDWFNTGLMREYCYHFVYPQVFPGHQREPEAVHKATLEWGRTMAKGWLQILNDHWLGSSNAYVCGKDITIADYLGAGALTVGDMIRVDFANYPNVDRWLGRMRKLGSWDSVHQTVKGVAGSMKEKSFVALA